MEPEDEIFSGSKADSSRFLWRIDTLPILAFFGGFFFVLNENPQNKYFL
jgi:hypothetical protein